MNARFYRDSFHNKPGGQDCESFPTTGRLVRVLVAGQAFSAGNHTFTFNASTLAAGIYFIRAQVPGRAGLVRKALLVK